ncbi:MAG: hypothetical protein HY552_03235 [Elusimicrobia bacterium]|nr:hypothetical protein [Elusimicrobiota bacterium]
MKLSAKWFLWFTGIGVYVMCLGGIFYYNLFKWTFDEKLKQESIDMVRLYAPTLVEGLSRSPGAISMPELDIVMRFSKDDRVASLLYFNKYGEVRWFKDPSLITKSYEDFTRQVDLPTHAVQEAMAAKTPVVRPVPNAPLYDIAIPLALRGDVLGLLDLQVSRAGVVAVIQKAMYKYAVGAVGVLLLLGIPLYFFLHNFVISPLLNLRDAVESISFKSLELKAAPRGDEVGELASALSIFLSKVKAEIANAMAKEKQRGAAEARWWEAILRAVVAKNHRAIVVDEDNTVLYANFPLGAAAAPEAKLHLLDVIDSQQQDVLRLVSAALDRPNQLVEADTTFRSEPCHVRAVHLDDDGDAKRTLILFEPKAVGARS